MSKSNTFETQLLALVFNATALPWAAAADLFIALHTADPDEAGAQNTNEATYGGYARVQVPRTNVGFTVSGNAVTNAALVQFPQCASGSSTITHFTIGTAGTGAGTVLYRGALTSSLAVSSGIQPQFAAGALTATES